MSAVHNGAPASDSLLQAHAPPRSHARDLDPARLLRRGVRSGARHPSLPLPRHQWLLRDARRNVVRRQRRGGVPKRPGGPATNLCSRLSVHASRNTRPVPDAADLYRRLRPRLSGGVSGRRRNPKDPLHGGVRRGRLHSSGLLLAPERELPAHVRRRLRRRRLFRELPVLRRRVGEGRWQLRDLHVH